MLITSGSERVNAVSCKGNKSSFRSATSRFALDFRSNPVYFFLLRAQPSKLDL